MQFEFVFLAMIFSSRAVTDNLNIWAGINYPLSCPQSSYLQFSTMELAITFLQTFMGNYSKKLEAIKILY